MRPIDADAMRQDWLENGENEHVYDTNAFLDSIDDQPTLDVVPVRHGRWKLFGISHKTLHVHEMVQCTECCTMFNRFSGIWYKYCPNCGAKMDAKEE